MAARKSQQRLKPKPDAVERATEDATPSTPVIYEAVRRLGDEEMARPATSLWWSGLAGGLSISFSLLAEAILRLHTPDASWRNLVTALGYPLGFLMVVLSRQQLFTETTITVMLPVMAEPTLEKIGRAARMWGIVLAANLVGTLFAALFCMFAPVVDPDLRAAMIEVSREGVMRHGWLETGFRAITSGYLMAAMVWLIPAAGVAHMQVVAIISYVIGVGGFAHIVAGSVYAFVLAVAGQIGVLPMIGGFMLPALVGNIIGGTVLFALISYAQVMKEI